MQCTLSEYYNHIHMVDQSVSGTELTKANIHTAGGISVRFPRVTKIRSDKNWETATNFEELQHLYKVSKEKTDVSLLNKLAASESYEPPTKKSKVSPKKLNKIDDFLKKKTSPLKKKMKSVDMINLISNNKVINTSKDETDKNEIIQLRPANPLPDAFKSKRIGFYPDFISFPEDVRSHLERHWIAYGGLIDKSIRNMNVHVVVHKDGVISFQKMQKLKRRVPEDVRHVKKDWLIHCINSIALCDTALYPVTVIP